MNYYDILEIEEDADSVSIKKAYKKLAKKFHPDLNPENVELAEKKFKQINEAYHVLIDEEERRKYEDGEMKITQLWSEKWKDDIRVVKKDVTLARFGCTKPSMLCAPSADTSSVITNPSITPQRSMATVSRAIRD